MDNKCSNDYCAEPATVTLVNGEVIEPLCIDCLQEAVGELVIENDDVHFSWDADHKTVTLL